MRRGLVRHWALLLAHLAIAAMLVVAAAPMSHAQAQEALVSPAKDQHHHCPEDGMPVHDQLPCPHLNAQVTAPLPPVHALQRMLSHRVAWQPLVVSLLGIVRAPQPPPPKPPAV
jgi:hypothetical protein